MQLQDHELVKGITVWYRYAVSETVYGPFTIQLRHADHEGPYVLLSGGEGDRRVYLADDEDYGALSFYDTSP